MSLFGPVREALSNYRQVRSLWRSERKTPVRVPWRRRWSYWRSGFLTDSGLLYQLDRPGLDRTTYLSDWERAVRSSRLNDPYGAALDNKLLFDRLIRPIMPESLPTLFGVLLADGRFHRTGGSGTESAAPAVRDFLDRERGVVIKPVDGGMGLDVLLVRRSDDGRVSLNGEPVSDDALAERVRAQPHSIVTSLLAQLPYSNAIAPFSVNTLRMLTFWDAEAQESFLGRAVHRFGNSRSGGMDNRARGGLSAMIDPVSGQLGRAAICTEHGAEWFDRHPDTDAAITGVVIPDWPVLAAQMVALQAALPFLPYIGWDVVVGDGGRPLIIEGNRFTGLPALQVHGGLLDDPRIRAFYVRHGVRR